MVLNISIIIIYIMLLTISILHIIAHIKNKQKHIKNIINSIDMLISDYMSKHPQDSSIEFAKSKLVNEIEIYKFRDLLHNYILSDIKETALDNIISSIDLTEEISSMFTEEQHLSRVYIKENNNITSPQITA